MYSILLLLKQKPCAAKGLQALFYVITQALTHFSFTTKVMSHHPAPPKNIGLLLQGNA